MPVMYKDFIHAQERQVLEVFKKQLVKLQIGDKENDKYSLRDFNSGFINVRRARLSELIGRIWKLNTRRY
jgi:Cft2 family RNA processing exonuclease